MAQSAPAMATSEDLDPAVKELESMDKTQKVAETTTTAPAPAKKAKPSASSLASKIKNHAVAVDLTSVWLALRYEFETQKMIWDSTTLTRGARHQGQVAMLRSKIELALLQSETAPDLAAAALQLAIARSTEGTDSGAAMLNTSTEELAQKVIKACIKRQAREKLAQALEDLSNSAPDRVKLTKDEAQAMANACDIQESKLMQDVVSTLSGK